MAVKVGINGFGRIGRIAFRAMMQRYRKDIEVVALDRGQQQLLFPARSCAPRHHVRWKAACIKGHRQRLVSVQEEFMTTRFVAGDRERLDFGRRLRCVRHGAFSRCGGGCTGCGDLRISVGPTSPR